MAREQYIDKHLENDVLTAIKNDLIVVLEFHERQQSGGFHSIPREVFCYIDYVATLCYGSASSKNATQFIEQYLGKIDSRYEQYGKLLYEMWRHGTVHEFDPKILKHSTEKYYIGWQTNNDSPPGNRECHLECFKVTEKNDRYLLNINLFQLVDHLVEAIRAFIDEIRANDIIQRQVQKNYEDISREMPVNDIPKKNQTIKRILDEQIATAIKNQKREVPVNS